MKLTRTVVRRLEQAARQAATRSYSPYSKFPVGAAVLSTTGKIYPGCNVENASFGLCNCAERTALFTAVTAGEQSIEAIAIYTPTQQATAPCGACRQVLHEFGPAARVISVCDGSHRIETSMLELLPAAFGPSDLLAST